MQWKKTPPQLVASFDKAVPKDPRVVRKPMFGYPALFLNGNMFAGTFQNKIVARLSDADRQKAITNGVKQFEPMPGRPMKEYIVVPATDVGTPAALRSWIARAHRHALTLPAKAEPVRKATLKKTTAKKK